MRSAQVTSYQNMLRPHHQAPSSSHKCSPVHKVAPPCSAYTASIALPAPVFEPVLGVYGWSTDFQQRYKRMHMVGEGSFGRVFRGVDLHTGQEVAVKRMVKKREKQTEDKTLQKIKQEVDLLLRLKRNQNVVRYIECFEERDCIFVVTELLNGGDLQRLSELSGPMPERALAAIAWEILNCIKACHNSRVLYGDIKPANFMLTRPIKNPEHVKLLSSGWMKAIDFGCSQYIPVSKRFEHRKGTPAFMAPEVFNRDYGLEVDMWSAGVTLYQLASHRLPFWKTQGPCLATTLEEVEEAVKNAPIEFDYGPWNGMTREGVEFIAMCLERNPAKRLTVADALQHPWFEKMRAVEAAGDGVVEKLVSVYA